MPRRKPVTLKDIAERLDVSTTVVSTVLNNRRSNVWVSDATRESVLAVARELGYEPRFKKEESILHPDHAKVLNVGILCMPWYNPLFGKTVSELCRTLGEWKFHPFIHVAPDRKASCKAGQQLHQQGRAEAFILLGSRNSLEELDLDETPYVVIGEVPEGSSAWCVCVNNVHGGQMVAEYLWNLGHRRVGLVGLYNSLPTEKRIEGFMMQWKELGATFPEYRILRIPEHTTIEAELPRFLQQLQQQDGAPPTALFCTGDTLAAPAVRVLKDNGWCIPEDISVVGFDDAPLLAECLDPPLTTVRMPYVQLGHLAAQLLRERIQQRVVSARHIYLPGELVVRRSCAPLSAERR